MGRHRHTAGHPGGGLTKLVPECPKALLLNPVARVSEPLLATAVHEHDSAAAHRSRIRASQNQLVLPLHAGMSERRNGRSRRAAIKASATGLGLTCAFVPPATHRVVHLRPPMSGPLQRPPSRGSCGGSRRRRSRRRCRGSASAGPRTATKRRWRAPLLRGTVLHVYGAHPWHRPFARACRVPRRETTDHGPLAFSVFQRFDVCTVLGGDTRQVGWPGMVPSAGLAQVRHCSDGPPLVLRLDSTALGRRGEGGKRSFDAVPAFRCRLGVFVLRRDRHLPAHDRVQRIERVRVLLVQLDFLIAELAIAACWAPEVARRNAHPATGCTRALQGSAELQTCAHRSGGRHHDCRGNLRAASDRVVAC